MRLKEIFRKATVRIQTTPNCQDYPDAVKVNPIFRNCRNPVDQIKMSLGLKKDQDFLLLTTGGISLYKSFTDDYSSSKPIVCTTNQSSIIQKGNLISLPMNSGIHFPDLVRASACVIGKAGYGTISECWGTSTPLQAVYRENFKESEILRCFAKSNLEHREISLKDFLNKNWDDNFPKNRKNQKKYVTLKMDRSGLSYDFEFPKTLIVNRLKMSLNNLRCQPRTGTNQSTFLAGTISLLFFYFHLTKLSS